MTEVGETSSGTSPTAYSAGAQSGAVRPQPLDSRQPPCAHCALRKRDNVGAERLLWARAGGRPAREHRGFRPPVPQCADRHAPGYIRSGRTPGRPKPHSPDICWCPKPSGLEANERTSGCSPGIRSREMRDETASIEHERARVRKYLSEARAECEVVQRDLTRAVADRDAAIRNAVALGLSRREIAAIVGLSPAGVQNAVRRSPSGAAVSGRKP